MYLPGPMPWWSSSSLCPPRAGGVSRLWAHLIRALPGGPSVGDQPAGQPPQGPPLTLTDPAQMPPTRGPPALALLPVPPPALAGRLQRAPLTAPRGPCPALGRGWSGPRPARSPRAWARGAAWGRRGVRGAAGSRLRGGWAGCAAWHPPCERRCCRPQLGRRWSEPAAPPPTPPLKLQGH